MGYRRTTSGVSRWGATACGVLILASGPAAAESVTYTYDALGRLTSASYASGTTAAYEYDPAGNRTEMDIGVQANQAPAAVNDTISTVQGTPHNFDPRINDSDPENGALTVTAKTNGTNGTVAIGGSGTSLTYTPSGGYSGPDSFTYTITDAGNLTDTATVNVTVNGSGVVAVDDYATVPFHSFASVYHGCMDPTLNDIEASGGPLTLTSFSQGAVGQVARPDPSNNTLCVLSTSGGTDTVTYTIRNNNYETDSGTIHLTF